MPAATGAKPILSNSSARPRDPGGRSPGAGQKRVHRRHLLGRGTALQRPAARPRRSARPRAALPSPRMRAAKRAPASTYVGSFNSTSACCGMFERLRSAAALLTARRIEGQQARMQETIAATRCKGRGDTGSPLVGGVGARREIQVFPVAVGLIGLHARTADLGRRAARQSPGRCRGPAPHRGGSVLCRASSRLYGSAASSSGVAVETCW